MSGHLKSATVIAGAPKAASQLRMLVLEALAAGAFNMVMATIITLILFHGDRTVPVWGISGVMFNTLPSSIIPASLMTYGITGLVRKRIAKGKLADHRAAPGVILRRLPAGLLARAGYLTLCTTLAAVSLTYLGIAIAGVSVLPFSIFLITQVIQAAIIGAILGPMIVARALCEPLAD